MSSSAHYRRAREIRRRRQYCAFDAVGAPCRFGGGHVPHRECEIWGPRRLPTRAQARLNVEQFVMGYTNDQRVKRELLIDHIATWGDCILHASHVLFETRECHCAPCSKAVSK